MIEGQRHARRDDSILPESLRDDQAMAMASEKRARRRVGQVRSPRINTATTLLALLAAAPVAVAQGCISLSGSTQCPAFSAESISTNSSLYGFFPFLQFVSDTASFDDQFRTYLATAYVEKKYEQVLGCGNVNLTDSSDLYARFTTTVMCNSIIQYSKNDCYTDGKSPKPACADTCVQFAESESLIKADSSLCSNPGQAADGEIRSDFTTCSLPDSSLSGACVSGADNEPDNCGFGNSTVGFCQYCGSGGQNSTDTCCYNSKADSRCAGVKLPTITGFATFSTLAPTGTATSSPSASPTTVNHESKKGLSAGAIAGIVIGALVAVALAIGLVVLVLMCLRRRNGSQNGSIFNQPSPARQGNRSGMAHNPAAATTTPAGYEVLPGGRIARMSALEGHSGDSPSHSNLAGGAAAGAAAGYAAGRRRRHDNSSSDEYDNSSVSNRGVLRPPPAGRRHGSLSSNSALGAEDPQSPISGSGGELSSPQGVTSHQSEQLPFFKDYYSQEEIHPGDRVSTLWAYQPRAGDEFALERGDMLKVVGIWDDGWATGVLTEERAEDWEAKRDAHRDSGVSHTSGLRDESPAASGEIKAFPLVCVCLPDHWRRTIDGDGSTETGSTQAGQSMGHS